MGIYKKQLPIAIVALLSTMQLRANFAHEYAEKEDPKRVVETVYCEEKCYTGKGVFVTGDYLLWHANECGLAFGVKTESPFESEGKVHNLQFEWDSGFRLGIGYRVPHDKWQLALTWTKFSTDADGHASGTVFPEYATGPVFGSFTKISGKWDLDLNILDGEMSRPFMATPKVGLKPHFGLRGVWIDQDYNSRFSGFADSHHYKMTNDFKGVGLRAGFDTQWDVANQWSLYANASYSLVYGHFKLKEKEKSNFTGAPSVTVANISDSFQQLVSVAEMGLGARWIYTFANCWAIRLQAGWEFNDFFGQNKFEHFATGPTSLSFVANNEDLTFQGFVFSGRFDF